MFFIVDDQFCIGQDDAVYTFYVGRDLQGDQVVKEVLHHASFFFGFRTVALTLFAIAFALLAIEHGLFLIFPGLFPIAFALFAIPRGLLLILLGLLPVALGLFPVAGGLLLIILLITGRFFAVAGGFLLILFAFPQRLFLLTLCLFAIILRLGAVTNGLFPIPHRLLLVALFLFSIPSLLVSFLLLMFPIFAEIRIYSFEDRIIQMEIGGVDLFVIDLQADHLVVHAHDIIDMPLLIAGEGFLSLRLRDISLCCLAFCDRSRTDDEDGKCNFWVHGFAFFLFSILP